MFLNNVFFIHRAGHFPDVEIHFDVQYKARQHRTAYLHRSFETEHSKIYTIQHNICPHMYYTLYCICNNTIHSTHTSYNSENTAVWFTVQSRKELRAMWSTREAKEQQESVQDQGHPGQGVYDATYRCKSPNVFFGTISRCFFPRISILNVWICLPKKHSESALFLKKRRKIFFTLKTWRRRSVERGCRTVSTSPARGDIGKSLASVICVF
jgi:hypothetical protein